MAWKLGAHTTLVCAAGNVRDQNLSNCTGNARVGGCRGGGRSASAHNCNQPMGGLGRAGAGSEWMGRGRGGLGSGQQTGRHIIGPTLLCEFGDGPSNAPTETQYFFKGERFPEWAWLRNHRVVRGLYIGSVSRAKFAAWTNEPGRIAAGRDPYRSNIIMRTDGRFGARKAQSDGSLGDSRAGGWRQRMFPNSVSLGVT